MSSDDVKRSRIVAVWIAWLSIATGVAAAPWLILGSSELRLVLVLALSIITQVATGASALFAAWAARDTDRLTD